MAVAICLSASTTSARDGSARAQREYAWDVVSRLGPMTHDHAGPVLGSWHRAEEVFASDELSVRSSSHGRVPAAKAGETMQSAGPEIIIFTLYNDAAYRHIRDNRLHQRAQLEHLRTAGPSDSLIATNRTVPPLPSDAVVLLTAWWPVARDRVTPLPVWDPELNPARQSGNSYITWQRAVAVEHSATLPKAATIDVDFAGRSFPNARRVSIEMFHHVAVHRRMAKRIMDDDRTRKAAVIALGRGIEEGDALALVAVHVATKQLDDWVWATLWWHDQPTHGPFARDRPAELDGPWRNYLLDVAFDANTPAAADQAPQVCFNPWLEARFPDAGSGGGTVSSCVACHRRASYPAVNFLPVTRGAPDLASDPAFAPGRLRTDFLWSLARQANALPAHGTPPQETKR